jgi:UDP-2-acetamido-2-deoxy-ribo-hexuluronate aminotransferase
LSLVACTSFFPSKPLGCYGDGGAIFTNDDDLATAMRQIRVHGQRQRYVHTRIGLGARMDTLQCAIVLAKLDRFDQELIARAQVAARYDKILFGQCDLIAIHDDRTSAYAQYTVKINERERVQAELQAAGIPTTVHYPVPIHLQPAYAHLSGQNEYAVAVSMSNSVMSLPMGPYQSLSDTEYVALSLLSALGDKRHGGRQRRVAHESNSISKPASIDY